MHLSHDLWHDVSQFAESLVAGQVGQETASCCLQHGEDESTQGAGASAHTGNAKAQVAKVAIPIATIDRMITHLK